MYTVLVLSPFAQGIQIALTDWTGFTPDFNYVGLRNFTKLWEDASWWHAVSGNIKLLIVVPIATLSLALFFASLLTRGGTWGPGDGVRGAKVYRVLFFFPYILPTVIVGILFAIAYKPRFGLLDRMLQYIGVDMLDVVPNGPLGNTDWILWAIALAAIWAGVGFFMVLFIAGIQQIPQELYESAALDGAGKTRTFFSVTLPLLWGHIQISTIYIGITVLDMFALVAVMARSGVQADFGADVMSTMLYRTAFQQNSQFGYASAMGTMLLIFAIIFALLSFRLTRREQIEY
jgi:N-acetylglucosamine transport system permease protein